MSDSLQLHGLQHTRLPCPSPTPEVYSNSCPLSRWCHPTIQSSVFPLLLPPSIFLRIRVFWNESALCIRWPKYWSFSFNISPFNEYSGLISFRTDWLGLPPPCSPRDSQDSSPTPQFKSIVIWKVKWRDIWKHRRMSSLFSDTALWLKSNYVLWIQNFLNFLQMKKHASPSFL